MNESVLVAVITGCFAVLAEVVIAIVNSKTMVDKLDKQSQLADARLEKAQAVTDTKLEELTREVRAHNDFAKRIPVLEEQIKVLNHRLQDLEKP